MSIFAVIPDDVLLRMQSEHEAFVAGCAAAGAKVQQYGDETVIIGGDPDKIAEMSRVFTYWRCREECECCDADVSPDMGDQ